MTASTISSFNYASVHLAPSEQIGIHQQDTWELSYVITGSGMRLIGDTTEAFNCGEVVLIPPEIPHCWFFDNDVTDHRGRIANITITFTKEFLENCQILFPELQPRIQVLQQRKNAVKFEKSKAESIIQLLESMRNLSVPERAAPFIAILLSISDSEHERIVGRFEKVDKEQKRLTQIQTYVVCNAKRDITIDDMAKYMGMNRSSFCIFFKKATGKTFISYLNDYRVEQACQLIANKDLSISDICYQVGFNNVPYFNRVFKSIKGVSPKNYKPQ